MTIKAWSDEAREAAARSRGASRQANRDDQRAWKIGQDRKRTAEALRRVSPGARRDIARLANEGKISRPPRPLRSREDATPGHWAARMGKRESNEFYRNSYLIGVRNPFMVGRGKEVTKDMPVEAVNPHSGIGLSADVDTTRGIYPFKPKVSDSYGQPRISPSMAEMIADKFDGMWDAAKVRTRGPIGSPDAQ